MIRPYVGQWACSIQQACCRRGCFGRPSHGIGPGRQTAAVWGGAEAPRDTKMCAKQMDHSFCNLPARFFQEEVNENLFGD